MYAAIRIVMRNPDILTSMRMASDIATAIHHTGIDPFTGEEAYVAKAMKDRKMQRAIMQFFKPENYFTVREGLMQAGRADLIGSGCDCLIPAHPPKEAIKARRRQANEAARSWTANDWCRSGWARGGSLEAGTATFGGLEMTACRLTGRSGDKPRSCGARPRRPLYPCSPCG